MKCVRERADSTAREFAEEIGVFLGFIPIESARCKDWGWRVKQACSAVRISARFSLNFAAKFAGRRRAIRDYQDQTNTHGKRIERMIHYTCDRCQRRIETEQETLFQIRIEMTSVAPPEPALDADEQAAREFMELDETIDEMAHSNQDSEEPEQLSFDLCSDCFTRYCQDPLGLNASELGFSKN
jgi:hypothetical protein